MSFKPNDYNPLIDLIIDKVAAKVAERLESTMMQSLEGRLANTANGQKLLVDTKELADQLSVSPSTIRKLREQGMPTVLIGDAVRFEPEAIKLFISKNLKNEQL